MDTPIQIPPNNTPPPGWRPTTSTVAGGVLGGAVSQLVIFTLSKFGVELDAATAGALTTVCVFAIGYLFPDGGRK